MNFQGDNQMNFGDVEVQNTNSPTERREIHMIKEFTFPFEVELSYISSSFPSIPVIAVIVIQKHHIYQSQCHHNNQS